MSGIAPFGFLEDVGSPRAIPQNEQKFRPTKKHAKGASNKKLDSIEYVVGCGIVPFKISTIKSILAKVNPETAPPNVPNILGNLLSSVAVIGVNSEAMPPPNKRATHHCCDYHESLLRIGHHKKGHSDKQYYQRNQEYHNCNSCWIISPRIFLYYFH